MDKKISVIIPTYNRYHLLACAIESVICQSYTNIELIIVDDNSTDDTEQLVKEYINKDSRVKYLKHDGNRGANAARNTGLKNATGEYVSFLDSDDEWEVTKLEADIKILAENKGFVICASNFCYVDLSSNKEIIRHSVVSETISRQDVLRLNCFITNDFMALKSNLLQIGGFDENLPARQDWDLWIRVLEDGLGIQNRLCLVKKNIFHGDQISCGIGNKLKGTRILLKKHLKLFKEDSQAYLGILKSLALMYVLDKKTKRAISVILRILKIKQNTVSKIKCRIFLIVLVVLGDKTSNCLRRYLKIVSPYNYLLR